MDPKFIQAVVDDVQRRAASGETLPQETVVIESFPERRRAKTKGFVTASIVSMVAQAGMPVAYETRSSIVPYRVGSLNGQFDSPPEHARQPLLAGNRGKVSRKKRKAAKGKQRVAVSMECNVPNGWEASADEPEKKFFVSVTGQFPPIAPATMAVITVHNARCNEEVSPEMI